MAWVDLGEGGGGVPSGLAGGDLGGTYPNPTVAAVASAAITDSTVIGRAVLTSLTAATLRATIGVGYQDEIHVAKSGGMLATIQAAVNAADALVRTLVSIHPGDYAENVDLTGKPLVELRGISTPGGSVSISGAAGTLLTLDTGTTGTNVSEIRFISTGAQWLSIPAGAAITDDYGFLNCAFITNINNAAIANGVFQLASGRSLFLDCFVSYVMTGTTGAATNHRLFNICGTANVRGFGNKINMNVADPLGNIAVIEELAAATVETLWQGNQIEVVTGPTWTGLGGIYFATGLGEDKHFQGNHIHFVSGNVGSGTIYCYLMIGTGGTLHSVGNEISCLDGANNYPWVIAGGDTVHSVGDGIHATNVPLVPGATQYYASMFNNIFKTNDLEIHDAADQTKIINFDASGITAAKAATLAFVNLLDAVYTFPPATTTLLGTGDALLVPVTPYFVSGGIPVVKAAGVTVNGVDDALDQAVPHADWIVTPDAGNRAITWSATGMKLVDTGGDSTYFGAYRPLEPNQKQQLRFGAKFNGQSADSYIFLYLMDAARNRFVATYIRYDGSWDIIGSNTSSNTPDTAADAEYLLSLKYDMLSGQSRHWKSDVAYDADDGWPVEGGSWVNISGILTQTVGNQVVSPQVGIFGYCSGGAGMEVEVRNLDARPTT